MIPAGDLPPAPVASFEFATATRIVFGTGTARELGRLARGFGQRALVVTGAHPERADRIRQSLTEAGVASEVCPIVGEPTTTAIATAVARARSLGSEVVLGFGGGSAIDAAKAIAGLLTNERELLDYLEVVGRGQPLARPAAPWIAVPTTAGAGAEVTRNAVLTSPEHRVKASLRSPHLLARLAVVDPELTLDLPPAVTAATGLDALTQLIEPFVCTRANPLTDALCRDGIPRVARALPRAFHEPSHRGARTEMALGALYGGLALANAGLGVVHGLAAPLGGSFPSPHGAVCAALLPAAMTTNLRALRERQPDSPALARYAWIAQQLTGDPAASPEAGAEWIRALVRELRIPGLRQYGLREADFAGLATLAAAASSMKANPLPLRHEEVTALLAEAW